VAKLKKSIYYLHGTVLAAFASIGIYITFQDAYIYSPPEAIWRATFFSIFLYVFLAFVLYALTKSHETTGLVATLLVLGLMYIWRTFLVVVLATGLAWLALAVVGKKFKTFQLHISLAVISVVMSIFSMVQFIGLVTSTPWNANTNLTEPINLTTSTALDYKPDIYYIILDGYGSAEMMKSLHGYDNSNFIDALEERGFWIGDKSMSNYTRTILSLGSSLNMQYLDDVSFEMNDSYLWWPLKGTVAKNQVRVFLESQGYESISLANGWDFTSMSVAENVRKPFPIFLNKFEELYFQSTNLSLFGFMNKFGISTPSYDTHRQTVLFEFEQLGKIPEDTVSPKFVFVHLISPHAPFIFDENGSHLTPDYPFTFSDDRYFLSPPSKYRSGYLAQLTFINQKVIETIDAILKNSPQPPIIILQGDHGSGVYIDYHSADNSCLYERFAILNAYYLPDIKVDILPKDINPVNTFRLVFNQYFGTDLDYLANRQFFSPSFEMYQFEDVTTRVSEPCQIEEIENP
jgi:hypothetical protein